MPPGQKRKLAVLCRGPTSSHFSHVCWWPCHLDIAGAGAHAVFEVERKVGPSSFHRRNQDVEWSVHIGPDLMWVSVSQSISLEMFEGLYESKIPWSD